jgi:predicted transcriptional regulator of viral defense system
MPSNNIIKLQELSQRLYFTTTEVAEILGIQVPSASVFCSRYAKSGLLVKLKNNYFTSTQKWQNISNQELYQIANMLQVPSYISLMSALSYYEVTSQMQQGFIESVALKRTITYNVREVVFKYYKLQKKYYGDFVKQGSIFIATKEKAFLDAMYLYSFGKYKIDLSSLDLSKLDRAKMIKMIKTYPLKTRKIVRNICKI